MSEKHIILFNKRAKLYCYSIDNTVKLSMPSNSIQELYPLTLYDMNDAKDTILSAFKPIIIKEIPKNKFIKLSELYEEYPELFL